MPHRQLGRVTQAPVTLRVSGPRSLLLSYQLLSPATPSLSYNRSIFVTSREATTSGNQDGKPPPRPSPHRRRAAQAGLRSEGPPRGPQARPRPCLQSPGNSAPGPAPAAFPYLAAGEARGQQLRRTPAVRYLCPQVFVCALGWLFSPGETPRGSLCGMARPQRVRGAEQGAPRLRPLP